MTLRLASTVLLPLLSIFSFSACRIRVAPVPAAAADRPADPSEQLADAWRRSRNADVDGAVRLFRELDAAGWDVPPLAAFFPALAEREEWRELARRIAAREPRTAHTEVAVTIQEAGLVPEGIAADPRDGTLFVGSIEKRKIVRVDKAGAARDFVPAASTDLGRVLGLKVDVRRDLLWALSNLEAGRDAAAGAARSSLQAFDLATGAQRTAVFLEGAGHLLNDLALTPDGTVFATDTEAGLVFRLPAGGSSLVATPHRFQSPNGIALVDGLLVVADDVGLWALHPEGGPPRRLLAPRRFPLGGIDGLSARGRTLVAVQNGLGAARVIRVELSGGAASVLTAEVLETANPLWHIPTTGAFLGEDFLYIGNSHLDAREGDVLAPEGRVPTRVHRLPVPR